MRLTVASTEQRQPTRPPEPGTVEMSPREEADSPLPPQPLAILAVLGAAILWGTLGVAYEIILGRYEVDPVTVVTLRGTTAAIVLVAVVMWRASLRRQLRELRQPGLLGSILGIGLFSTAAFYVVLIYAYREAGVAVGTVLLYLAPTIVTIISVTLFGIPLTAIQVIALILAFLGVVGVSGAASGVADVSWLGILLGVLSAAAYASYSIFGQIALRHLRPAVVTATSLAIGSVVLWLAKLVVSGTDLPGLEATVVIAGATGVGITLLPLSLYTYGLSRLGPPRASVLAIAEPAVAVILAWLILGETLAPTQMVGAVAIALSLGVTVLGRVRR